MKNRRFQALALFSFLMLLGAAILPSAVEAAADPTTGWAWSGNTGWISFSNKNCDPDGDGFSNGQTGCPTSGTAIAAYGVTVDGVSGEIAGYSWSENIGWISFNAADVASCPSAPCAPTFDKKTGLVSGWAKALSTGGGWDGFIHLRGTSDDGTAYGVFVVGCDWDGFAWGADVMGWIQFKGPAFGVKSTGNACQTSNDLLVSGNPAPPAGTLTQGHSTTFLGTVKNDGTGVIGSAFNNQFKIDIGNDGNVDVILSPATQITSLGGGQTKSITSAEWTDMPEGTHRVILCADQPNPPAIDEYNETNNCSPATGTSGIFTVVDQTLTVVLSATSPDERAPFTATFTASTSGTSLGKLQYYFWWNCSSTTANRATAETSCGSLPTATAGTCASNDNGARCADIDALTQTVSHQYIDGGNYTAKVIAERGTASSAQDQEIIPITAQSLSVALTSTPSSGLEPVNSTLEATVSGTAVGGISYHIWANCASISTSVGEAEASCGSLPAAASGACATNENGKRCVGVSQTSTSHAYTYSTGNDQNRTFTPKAIAERGSAAPAEARSSVSITAQTLTVDLATTPATGTIPLPVKLKATTSGNATGNIDYYYWWNCSNTSTSTSATESACGTLPNPAAGTCAENQNGSKCSGISETIKEISHTYESVGSFTPKVIVVRGAATNAKDQETVTTVQQTLSVALGVSPATGVRPLETTITATLSGTAPGSANYSFWWNCSSVAATTAQATTDCGALPVPTSGSCVENNAGAKCDGMNVTTLSQSHTYAAAGTYTPKVVVERGSAPSDEDRGSVTANLPPVDLSVSGSPTPPAGTLTEGYNTTFTGTVKNNGTAAISSTFGNTFKIDLDNNGSVDITLTPSTTVASLAAGASQSITSASWNMVKGTHRVILCSDEPTNSIDESDDTNNCSATAGTAGVFTVVGQTLSVAVGSSPSSGIRPVQSTITATTTGTALGSINYAFWWNCASTASTVSGAVADCGALPTPVNGSCVENSVGAKCDQMNATTISRTHSYAAAGTYTPKVVVERGSAPSDEDRGSVTANLPPVDLSVSGSPIPPAGTLTEGYNTTFTGTIRNGGTGNITSSFNNTFKIDIDNNGSVDVTLAPATIISSINGGAQQTITSASWNNMLKGTHRAILCADETGDTVDESDETNNCSPTTGTSGIFTVVGQTLTANVGATSTDSRAPMKTTITATAGGTAPGSANYAFWWDCANTSTSIATVATACGNLPAPVSGSCVKNDIGAKCDNINSATQSVENTYANGGVYSPKVIIERGTAPAAEDRTSWNVPDQSLLVDLTANPASGIRPVNSSLTATVSGTAPGNTNYSFWWNCSSIASTVSGAVTDCGALPAPTNGSCVVNDVGAKCDQMTSGSVTITKQYTDAGTYTPKVVVERGSAPSTEDRASVVAELPPYDLLISLNPSPTATSTLIEGYTTAFSGTVKNNGTGNIAASFKNTFKIDLGNNGSIDVTLTPENSIASLNGGATQAITSATWDMVKGTHRIILCSDEPGNAIDEADDTNNCSSTAGTAGVFTVVGQTLTANMTLSPATGVRPLDATISVAIDGTAPGTANYAFWWNCASPVVTVSEAVRDCGALPAPTSGQCVENGNGAKCDGMNETTVSRTRQYATAATYTPKTIVERGSASPAEDHETLTVTLPPLDLSISINPAPGTGTLTEGYSTTFTGAVKNSGTSAVSNSFNNTFKIDLDNNGSIDITLTPPVAIASLGAGAQKSVSATWDNMVKGTHRAILCSDEPGDAVDESVENNNCSPNTGTAGIFTVVGQTLSTTISASPSVGVRPLTTTITASVSGTAPGSTNYSFWWNCSDTSTIVSNVVASCGALPAPTPGSCVENSVGAKCDNISSTTISRVHTYSQKGTYTPKVVVERGSAPSSENRTTVTTELPPTDLLISINPSPASSTLTEGFSTTFLGTVKNNGTGAITSPFSNTFKLDLGNDGSVDITLTPTTPISSLAGGAQQTVTSATWNNMLKGTHRVILCSDEPGNAVDESNETNNCSPTTGTAGVFTVLEQSINVTFTTSTTNDPAPYTATLTTTISGTAPGEANYSYWWNCSNDFTGVSAAAAACGNLPTPVPGQCVLNNVGAKCDGLVLTTHNIEHTYVNGGTYSPKVIVERGSAAPVQRRASLTISQQTLDITLSANPTTGTEPLNTTLSSAVVSGTASGPVTYSFWWNCSTATTSVSAAESSCGNLPAPAAGQCIVDNNIGARCREVNATTQGVSHSYGSGTYTAKTIVERGTARPDQAQTTVTVSNQELFVTLSSTQTSGVAPLATTLSADVSGTAPGTVNYSFWWNCSSATSSVSAASTACGSLPTPAMGGCAENQNGYKCDGIATTTQNIAHTYESGGTFVAKVIVERGVATPTQNQKTITVTQQTLGVTYTASPSSGLAPLSTTFTADVAGSAPGTINYSFWWDCANATTSVAGAAATCGALPTPLPGTCVENLVGVKCDGVATTLLSAGHTYINGGTYTGKVIVERGTATPTEKRAGVTATAQTVSIALVANPSSGTAPVTSVVTATVSGTAQGTINYSFWWSCASTSTSAFVVAATCGSLPAPFEGGCVENQNGVKCNGIANVNQSVVHTYVDSGIYSVKTIVERGAAPAAEKRTLVTVAEPPPQELSVTLASNPANGVSSVSTELSAKVGGDATGETDYYFWWNCDNISTNISSIESACGNLPNPPAATCEENQFGARCKKLVNTSKQFNHGYIGPKPGEPGPKIYHPKVVVERGTAPAATALTQIRVDRSAIVPVVIECSDGVDNNNDGKVDFPVDSGCGSFEDPKEDEILLAPTGQCNDLIDNDGDGKVDYPEDPGCISPFDPTEDDTAPSPVPVTECNDGIDNNGDGIADDPDGCGSPWDLKEDNIAVIPLVACNNGRDDDRDGKIDYPADPGCLSPNDPDERDQKQPGFQEVPPAPSSGTSGGGGTAVCNIKGDITALDEKLYYPSSCPAHDTITIEAVKGEKLFCNEFDAINAGWRKHPTCQ